MVGEFLQKLRRLRVDKSKGIAKPYKPLLLSAVVLHIGKGKLRGSPKERELEKVEAGRGIGGPGCMSEGCAKQGETATRGIVARDANDKLRYAVRANPRLTL